MTPLVIQFMLQKGWINDEQRVCNNYYKAQNNYCNLYSCQRDQFFSFVPKKFLGATHPIA